MSCDMLMGATGSSHMPLLPDQGKWLLLVARNWLLKFLRNTGFYLTQKPSSSPGFGVWENGVSLEPDTKILAQQCINSLPSTPSPLEVQPPPSLRSSSYLLLLPKLFLRPDSGPVFSVLPTHVPFRRIPVYHLEIVAQETPSSLPSSPVDSEHETRDTV